MNKKGAGLGPVDRRHPQVLLPLPAVTSSHGIKQFYTHMFLSQSIL